MKSILLILVTASLFITGTSRAQMGNAASLDFFYENLDPYGDWREVGDYGYAWQPRNVHPNWSPYSEGRWLYSDVGWTWDSDEPFGWAVYHYGRWANVANVGWIWVPGTEWGPGWVSWRQSDQYVGWAPLPPEARFRSNIGFSSWVDNYYGIGPGHYRFVENQNFGSRRLSSVFLDQSQNYNIINRTSNITNIRYENNIIRNDGPRYDYISQLSTEPIRQYKLQRRQDFDRDSRRHSADYFQSRRDEDALSVFAPPMDERRPSSGPRRHAERLDDARINRGWERAGSPAEIATLRSQMKGKVEAPKELPPEPRFDRDIDRPGGPRANPNADRPPTSRESGPKGKPDRPTTPVQDSPPTGRPGPDMEKENPQSRPPGSTRPERGTPDTQRPGSTRPDMKRPDESTPGTTIPETQRPGSTRPDMQKPDGPKPETTIPETQRPDSTRPDMKKPDRSTPGTSTPEIQRPGSTRPDMKKPEARKPETSTPEVRRPEGKKPETRPEPPKREQPKAKAPQQKKPEASRPDMKKPETQRPEGKKPEARPEPQKREQPKSKAPQQKKTESSRPDMKKSEARRPESKKPEARSEPPKREQSKAKAKAPQSRPAAPSKPQSDKAKDDKSDKKKATAKSK